MSRRLLALCLSLSCALPAPLRAAAERAPAGETSLDWAVRERADAARLPQARAQVLIEGRLGDDPALREGLHVSRDWFDMLCLALAARATGEPGYAERLRLYLEAWVAVYEPSYNPVSETDFHYLALAYALGRAQGAFPPALQARSEALFRRMALAYLDEQRDPRPSTRRNNWQSHRVKLATALAYALRDPELMARSRQLYRNQIERSITPAGQVYDFEERDALHYVVYSLEGLLTAALIARLQGEDWYWYETAGGAGLNQALLWLSEYASGAKTHTEFQHTTVEFDRQRARRGVPGFSGLWQPRSAASCYQLAAGLAPHWLPLARRLGPMPGWVRELLQGAGGTPLAPSVQQRVEP